MKGKLLTSSRRVVLAMEACNAKGQDVPYRTAWDTSAFLASFREATSRPLGPHAAEINGMLHDVPRLFEILLGKAKEKLKAYRNASHLFSSFEHESQQPSARDAKEAKSQAYLDASANWAASHRDLLESRKKKEKEYDKAWQEVVDLFDFLSQMAEFGNWRTMFKYDFQPKAANIFHGMVRDMYQPGKPKAYPFADVQISTIIMRYLGSPHLRFPADDKPEYFLFQQIVRELMRLWGFWSNHPEFYDHILRALHRTDQLSILKTALYYDNLIPAYLRYAEEADGEHRREKIESGSYGQFDPKNPLALLEKHRDRIHTAYMISDVLQLILHCYYKPVREDWPEMSKYLK